MLRDSYKDFEIIQNYLNNHEDSAHIIIMAPMPKNMQESDIFSGDWGDGDAG